MRPPIGGVVPNDDAYEFIDEMERILAKKEGNRKFGLNKVVARILNRAAEAYPQLLNDVLGMEYFQVSDSQSDDGGEPSEETFGPPPGSPDPSRWVDEKTGRLVLGPGYIDRLPSGKKMREEQEKDKGKKTGTEG